MVSIHKVFFQIANISHFLLQEVSMSEYLLKIEILNLCKIRLSYPGCYPAHWHGGKTWILNQVTPTELRKQFPKCLKRN